jgi:hypothetical protein
MRKAAGPGGGSLSRASSQTLAIPAAGTAAARIRSSSPGTYTRCSSSALIALAVASFEGSAACSYTSGDAALVIVADVLAKWPRLRQLIEEPGGQVRFDLPDHVDGLALHLCIV